MVVQTRSTKRIQLQALSSTTTEPSSTPPTSISTSKYTLVVTMFLLTGFVFGVLVTSGHSDCIVDQSIAVCTGSTSTLEYEVLLEEVASLKLYIKEQTGTKVICPNLDLNRFEELFVDGGSVCSCRAVLEYTKRLTGCGSRRPAAGRRGPSPPDPDFDPPQDSSIDENDGSIGSAGSWLLQILVGLFTTFGVLVCALVCFILHMAGLLYPLFVFVLERLLAFAYFVMSGCRRLRRSRTPTAPPVPLYRDAATQAPDEVV